MSYDIAEDTSSVNPVIPLTGKRLDLANQSVAWLPCHIGEGAIIGSNCVVGCLAHIGRNVALGDGTRVQGGAYIADCSQIGEGVFIGPNSTILNDRHPPSGSSELWHPVEVGQDAVIGGGATLVAGISIGARAVVAAGAVVTKDVPADEVWAGVPAQFLMSRLDYEGRRGG